MNAAFSCQTPATSPEKARDDRLSSLAARGHIVSLPHSFTHSHSLKYSLVKSFHGDTDVAL